MESNTSVQQAALRFLDAFYYDEKADSPDINWSRVPAFATLYQYLKDYNKERPNPRILTERDVIVAHTALSLLALPTTKSPWGVGEEGFLELTDDFMRSHSVLLISEDGASKRVFRLSEFLNAVPLVIKAYNFFKSILSIPHEYDQRNL